MSRKVKELDPYIKARVGEALLKLEGLIKPSNLSGTSRLYYTGQWAKDVYDNYTNKQAAVIFKKVEKLKQEFVATIIGKVVKRDKDTVNKDIPTGEIEVKISDLVILSQAQELPMPVFGEQEYPEDIMLKYRFLDLRR